MKLYKRQNYLQKIRGFYQDKKKIKILTGIRGSGKSCIMEMIMNELRWRGNSTANLIHIDLDAKEFKNVKNAEKLRGVINERLVKSREGIIYLFIDEIQMVEGFEELLFSLYQEDRCSIFLSASSSYILSEDFESRFRDSYKVFEILPLSYSEYEGMKDFMNLSIEENPILEFSRYVHDGGMPKVLQCADLQEKRKYLTGILEEIFKKDIAKMEKIRHVAYFKTVQDYIIDTFGESISMTRLTDYFRNEAEIPVKRETLERYLEILEKAKLVYRCNRFDIKTEKELQGDQKYYLTDMGFYFANKSDSKVDYSLIMKNVIFMYLKSKDYNISTGRIGKRECDFVLSEIINSDDLQDYGTKNEHVAASKKTGNSGKSRVIAQVVTRNAITERLRAVKEKADARARESAMAAVSQKRFVMKNTGELGTSTGFSEPSSLTEVLEQYLNENYKDIVEKKEKLETIERFEVDDKAFESALEADGYGVSDEKTYSFKTSDEEAYGYNASDELMEEDDQVSSHTEEKQKVTVIYRYIKFTFSTADPYTERLEYAALDSIRDNYPKYMLTMDSKTQEHNDIVHLNVIEALKNEYKF